MKELWSFYWDCGRSGNVEGLFVATESEVQETLGKKIYFGEILGKHSEVYGVLEEGDVTKMELDSETVEKVEKILGTNWSGYNPLDYIEYSCSKCEDNVDSPDDLDEEGVCEYCRSKMDEE